VEKTYLTMVVRYFRSTASDGADGVKRHRNSGVPIEEQVHLKPLERQNEIISRCRAAGTQCTAHYQCAISTQCVPQRGEGEGKKGLLLLLPSSQQSCNQTSKAPSHSCLANNKLLSIMSTW